MTNKNLIVLAGVAVVLGGAAFVLSGNKTSAPKLNGKAIFPALNAAEVAQIAVGDKLKLSATDEGWKIDSYFGYPADRAKIADNLLKLAELKVGQVARSKKLDKTDALVLSDASGKELAALPLGPRHDKWGRGRYATFAGETVLVSDNLDAFDGDAKRWLETKIVDEPWVSFNDVMDPKADAAAYGFATGVVAKVKIGSDTNRTATVGAAVKGGTDRYVKLDGADWVYTVPSYSVESLLPKKAEPKKAEPPKAEPKKVEVNKEDPPKAEPKKVEPKK